MQKAISIFRNSAGALLLALASALFLINWTSPADSVQPHDPIFLVSLNDLFWIIGGLVAVMALVCFFSERPRLAMFVLAWLAVNFLVCRIGLYWDGCPSLTGYLGGFSYAFGISAKAANAMTDMVFAYLLIGSCLALWILRRLPPPVEFQKMSCPACGAHVKFAAENLGQQIPCPQCQTIITLRKPGNLKMSCFFCHEHIEFPVHALGQKIKCPHCQMDITLKGSV